MTEGETISWKDLPLPTEPGPINDQRVSEMLCLKTSFICLFKWLDIKKSIVLYCIQCNTLYINILLSTHLSHIDTISITLYILPHPSFIFILCLPSILCDFSPGNLMMEILLVIVWSSKLPTRTTSRMLLQETPLYSSVKLTCLYRAALGLCHMELSSISHRVSNKALLNINLLQNIFPMQATVMGNIHVTPADQLLPLQEILICRNKVSNFNLHLCICKNMSEHASVKKTQS